MIEELRALRATAPSGLQQAVLRRVGLADVYATVRTAVGAMFVAYSNAGVSAIEPATDARTFEATFARRFGREVTPAFKSDPIVERVRRFLDGEGSMPPVDLRGLSPFAREVLAAAQRIPRGEVRPYAWIAREIGHPAAVRAVGTALGRNPIPLVIPCHRVVRGEGGVGNYAFGAPMKRALLEHEGVDMERLDELARRGVRFVGSDTTKIFCFPTCRDARRVTDKHRVELRNEAHAHAAGYRPCKHCRPAMAS